MRGQVGAHCLEPLATAATPCEADLVLHDLSAQRNPYVAQAAVNSKDGIMQ